MLRPDIEGCPMQKKNNELKRQMLSALKDFS
jgi:hypothetical protein